MISVKYFLEKALKRLERIYQKSTIEHFISMYTLSALFFAGLFTVLTDGNGDKGLYNHVVNE